MQPTSLASIGICSPIRRERAANKKIPAERGANFRRSAATQRAAEIEVLGARSSARTRIDRIGGFCGCVLRRQRCRRRFPQSCLQFEAQLCRQFNFGITRERGCWLPGSVVVVRWFEHYETYAYRVPAVNSTLYQGESQLELQRRM